MHGACAKPACSTPLPKWIRPCLPTLIDKLPVGPQWVHEIKWDGYRVSVYVAGGKATARTRNGHDWTARFPAIAAAAELLPVRSAVIDGEAVILDDKGRSNFAELQADLTRHGSQRAVLYAFDLLFLDGEVLWKKTLEERREALAGMMPSKFPILFSESFVGAGADLFKIACENELRTARPCDILGTDDSRVLGLYISGLSINDGFETRDVAINDALLCIGFHAVEEGVRRWTTGRARLPAALWEGCEDSFYMRVELAGMPLPRWIAPAAEAAAAERPRLSIVVEITGARPTGRAHPLRSFRAPATCLPGMSPPGPSIRGTSSPLSARSCASPIARSFDDMALERISVPSGARATTTQAVSGRTRLPQIGTSFQLAEISLARRPQFEHRRHRRFGMSMKKVSSGSRSASKVSFETCPHGAPQRTEKVDMPWRRLLPIVGRSSPSWSFMLPIAACSRNVLGKAARESSQRRRMLDAAVLVR